MQFQTTLTNAAGRVLNRRDGSGQFTLYEIFDQQGQAWVVKQDVFNFAQSLVGQQVEIVGRVEQNGQYTNRYADFVQLAGASGQQGYNPAAQQMQAANPVLQAQQAGAQAGRAPDPGPVYPTPRDRSITRQTAGKVAALISGNDPATFWSNIRDLTDYFDTGVIPAQFDPNQMVPAGFDDGIPFMPTLDPHGI